jgi:hypothetical protein
LDWSSVFVCAAQVHWPRLWSGAVSKWANLRAWWAEGIPIAVIAERVGVTYQAVWAAASYRGLRRPRVSIWNKENSTKLRTWWGEGVRTREIAERLGTTRGAVIGKADRMGLPPHALNKPGGRR